MKGPLLIIISGVLFGSVGVFVKLIGPSISPFLLTFARLLLAAAIIFLAHFLVKSHRSLAMKKGDVPLFVAAGFSGITIGFGLFVAALSIAPVADVVLLVYIYPIITALLAAVFLKERIGKREIAALIIMSAGVWVIYGFRTELLANIGNLFAIISGVGYSFGIIIARHVLHDKGYSLWAALFWPFVFGSLLLVLLFPFEALAFAPSAMGIWYFLGLVIISTAIPYGLYDAGLRSVEAHMAPILTILTEPLSAVLLAWIILGEGIGATVIAGGILIVLANILAVKEGRKVR
ncbi:MAG: DMT family transporter [Candidatus Aenigmarchaeota archaeon]|nr:DMT family transporter [Candidatus Aenigmarchaeota archaeon]